MTKLEAWLEIVARENKYNRNCHHYVPNLIAVIEKLKAALEDLSCLNEPDLGLSKNEYIACLEQNKYLTDKALAIYPGEL